MVSSSSWDFWVEKALARLQSLELLRSLRPISFFSAQESSKPIDDEFETFDGLRSWDRSSVEIQIAEPTFQKWVHNTPSSESCDTRLPTWQSSTTNKTVDIDISIASMDMDRCVLLPLLPQDIIYEILLRVPAESLIRFKTVCKLWSQFISDQNFAHAQLTHQVRNFQPNIFFSCVKTTTSYKYKCDNFSINLQEKVLSPKKIQLHFKELLILFQLIVVAGMGPILALKYFRYTYRSSAINKLQQAERLGGPILFIGNVEPQLLSRTTDKDVLPLSITQPRNRNFVYEPLLSDSPTAIRSLGPTTAPLDFFHSTQHRLSSNYSRNLKNN